MLKSNLVSDTSFTKVLALELNSSALLSFPTREKILTVGKEKEMVFYLAKILSCIVKDIVR